MIRDVEVLVIGGGPAGLCAAKAAADSGAHVLLLERDDVPGGQLVKHPNVEILTDTTVLGIYEDGVVTALKDEKHLKFRPKKTIVATGAAEKFLTFPNNDLPGIYGAGAVQTLMNVGGVKPAERVVMVGAGNIGLIVSYQMLQAGVDVACVVEAAPNIGGFLVHAAKLRRAGVPIQTGWTVKDAYGNGKLEGVILCRLDEK